MLTKPTAHSQHEAKRCLSQLVATRMPRYGQAIGSPLGRFHAGGVVLPCALGQAGIGHSKREGDKATPAGAFRLLQGFYRRDRLMRQAWALPMAGIGPSDGWCDDPGSGCYNRRVKLPCRATCEKLWRRDHLYDLLVVLNYNIHPRRKSRGSGIFLHCARPNFAPTEGCVALRFEDLRRLLPRLSRKTQLIIR